MTVQKFLRISSLFLFFLVSTPARTDVDQCSQSWVQWRNQKILTKTVSPFDRAAFPSFERFFKKLEGVYLGVKDPHHFYLKINEMMIEAEPLQLVQIKDPLNSPSYIPAGLIFELNHVPPEALEKLKYSIQKKDPQARALSCVHGVCHFLESAGIYVGSPDTKPNVFLTPTIQKIIEEGFKTEEGKAIQYTLYINSEKSFEKFFTELKKDDERILKVQTRLYRNAPGNVESLKDFDPKAQAFLMWMIKEAQEDPEKLKAMIFKLDKQEPENQKTNPIAPPN